MLQSRSTLIFSFFLHCMKLSWVSFWLVPANICLDEDILKRSWRRLLSSSSENVLIKTNIFALVIRPQKTSSRRLGQDEYIRLGYTSSRCLAKSSSRHLQDVLLRSLRRFEDISSSQTVLVNTLSRSIQHVFEMYSKDGYL